MPVPLPILIVEALERSFTLHKLWLAPDAGAMLADIAPRIRAIATGVPILADGVAWPVTAERIASFPRLEVIANLGVGYDNIDAGAAKARGVAVTNTPDVLTEETADTAFGLLLNAVRQFPAAENYLRAGKWLEKAFPLSASLRHRTLGILGLGRIGKAIARRGEAFGLKIAYHNRKPDPSVSWDYHPNALELAKACDILMVAVPGGGETTRIVDARVLDALGPNGILINIARGTVVDEAALIDALQKGKILTAGLDVFEKEPAVPQALIEMEHVVLLPHVGSASTVTRDAMNQLVIDNLLAWKHGQPLLTQV
ncbi:MAG: 2-hydroxyacid dehydrogenase [Alphaproteobacteria bacterium]|nr:2-hydroxyacid dehydrogenase [Alphaproteobacteria bacterium]